MATPGAPSRLRLFSSTTPLVLLLLGVVAYNTFVLVYSQMSSLGEQWYPGYHELREPPAQPDCDPDKAITVAPAEEDLFEGILDEEDPKPDARPAPAEDDAEDDDDALLDDLLGEEKTDNTAALKAAQAAQAECKARWASFESIKSRRTEAVVRFRTVERWVEAVRDLGLDHQRHALILILLICAATASATRHHIALRPARTALEHRVSEFAQLVAVIMLAVSAWAHKGVEEAAGIQIQNPELYTIWVIGFGVMALINLYNLVRVPPEMPAGGSLGKALLTIPLYTSMCLISGAYFWIKEAHPAGLSIYLSKLPEFARLYLQVGLYVWVGMLLKRTRLAHLVFDVLRPWKLPPELFAFVVVVGAALPTAYSGASGIFVIAVGAVIYEELRRAGARRQLALAATAMSGSLGVVLRPCLLVVIVASLNKQVTTDQLYGWGLKVFLLTAVLFLIASLLTRVEKRLSIERPGVALPASLRALGPIVPYIIIMGTVLVVYGLALDAWMGEIWSPYILPVLLLAVLIYDRRAARKADPTAPGYVRSVESATTETAGHIGALLFLMGLSICLGGIVERADLMAMVPETFGSIWTTMGLLVVVLVVIGMIMDPYGAVILVSATIATVAYRNGIDPVHFWMVVLVAFELGYLTPPVALNHLLTRQVVGEAEAELAAQEGETFWRRHEKVLLPVTVMAMALLIVAFGPLIVGY